MHLEKLIPCVLAGCLALTLTSSALAQNIDTRERQVPQNSWTNDPDPVPDNSVIVLHSSPGDIRAPSGMNFTGAASLTFHQLISTAIDQRLGARYSWGAAGPSRFDCSGFVWSTFQSAGINFERSSARTLWARFAPAAPEEKFRYGTLVFFGGLTHIGIVADELGFYHASRHHGVVYSPFNKYWLSRVDGFRRVPLSEQADPTTD